MAEPALKRLKELLRLASQLPFYQDRFLVAGLTPALLDEGTLKEIETAFLQLPLLSQAEVRQRRGECLTSVAAIAYRGVTSGTTDDAFIYFRDNTWNALRLECLEAALATWQILPEDTIINVCSRLFPLRRNDISLVGLPDGKLRGWLKTLAVRDGVVLRGFPSRLCELIIQETWTDLCVKAVICTGEPLFEHQIVLIKTVLGCSVINEYGSQECGLQLWSCPDCEQLHPETQRCLIEVVNEEVVVTDLFSDVMPLIRYRNGDRAHLVPSTCPRCDWILIPKGRKSEQLQIQQSLPALPHIHYYRIMSEELQGLTLLYLPKQQHVPALPTHLSGYPPRRVKQWLAVSNGVEFWNQIHPLSLMESKSESFEENHSLALSCYIEACLDSDRWIFYRLPAFMRSAQQQLAERQDGLNGFEAREIDRCLLRLLCHEPPFSKQLHLWLSSLEQRDRQYEDQQVPRIEYVALKLLQLGDHQIPFSGTGPIDRVAYRSLIALLENTISHARRAQPELPILSLSTLLPLFLTDLTHYFQSPVAVLEHWAVLLGRLQRDSDQLTNLPPQLAQRELWLRTRSPMENPDSNGTKELVEACIQAVLSDRQDQLLRFWNQLEQISSNLPKPVAACFKASFARKVAAAYLQQGDSHRSYDALLSTVISLPQQESFEHQSRLSNGKQRLW